MFYGRFIIHLCELIRSEVAQAECQVNLVS
jgi:hypothetical protein